MTRLLLAALAVLLSGCAALVVPPEPPPEARPVFLLDHGRHATLVLSHPDGGLVRYAYGDLAYYGHNRVGLWRALAAVAWPTPGGLGRRELEAPASPAGVRQAVAVPIEAVHVLVVAADRAAALGARLDARFARGYPQRRFNPWYDLVFVPDPAPYWLGNNSNLRVAAWLEALGVEVRGGPLWSRWTVRAPGRGGRTE